MGWLTPAAVVGIGVGPACGQPAPAGAPAVEGPLALVNVMQGMDSTGGFSHGNTLPLVGTPWGMTDWSIQNAGGIDERWFYAAKNTRFMGFRATRQPSPWVGDYGQFVVAPQTDGVALEADRRACDYDPATTVRRPDYARVRLDRYLRTAELTASERCGVLRVTLDPTERSGRLVVDVAGDGKLLVHGNRLLGYSRSHESPAADFRAYFVAELDRPVTASRPIGTDRAEGGGWGTSSSPPAASRRPRCGSARATSAPTRLGRTSGPRRPAGSTACGSGRRRRGVRSSAASPSRGPTPSGPRSTPACTGR